MTERAFVFNALRIAIPVFFISDGVNKILVLTTGNATPSFSPSLLTRSLFEVLALIIIVHKIDKERLRFLFMLSVLGAFYFLGVLTYSFSYEGKVTLLSYLSVFNKYMFVFVLYYFSYSLIYDASRIQEIFSLCEKIFFINSVFIILGFIFNIQLFKSYPLHDYRYGYNGLIPAINETTAFYLIALSAIYYRIYVLHQKRTVFHVTIIVGALLLGAKGIYFFILLLLLYHFIRNSSLKSKLGVLFSLLIIVSFFWFSYFHLEIKFFDYFNYILSSEGVWTLLMSGRNLLFEDRFFANMEHWSLLNFLFGGQDPMAYLIEMDMVDGFLSF